MYGLNKNIAYCLIFIDYFTDNNKWIDIDLNEKKDIVHGTIIFYPDMLDNLIINIKWTEKVRWVDLIKSFGSQICEDVFEQVTRINLVDFSDPIPEDYIKEWVWIGPSGGATYEITEYFEHPIKSKFNHIKTLNDIYSNIEMLSKEIDSRAYFHVNDPKESKCHNYHYYSDVFYRDHQYYYLWALADDGSVYIKNNDNPYITQYVAKSLPEFLSHLNDD